MYMIKCIRNEFCFEYINIYIKNEFFVKIEFFIGKKIFWYYIVIKSLKIEKKVI